MRFDYLVVASWADISLQQTAIWARELRGRGEDIAILVPSAVGNDVDGVPVFTLSEYEPSSDECSSPATIESRFNLPSIDHLVWTERKYFALNREQALHRACKLGDAYASFFTDHSFDTVVQVRGPEIHRLLAHYAVEANGGTSVWVGFSPFDGTCALTTALNGSWISYRTANYEQLSKNQRSEVRAHVEAFREEQRFYAHEDDRDESTTENKSITDYIFKAVGDVLDRNRPGSIPDQIRQEARLGVQSVLNERLLPTVSKSRQLCEQERYVFFPWQYNIESRLTVFSPQFFDQIWLVEYLARVLPSSVKLFVKGHPNHPGRPDPRTIRHIQNLDRVTVLANDLNAHHAIAQSDGVVVVNNTVGFETLYHRKPLFVLGTAPYADTPGATDVDDLSKLPEILADEIGSSMADETVVESIHSLRTASYPGDRTSFDPDDVATLVDSVETFLAEHRDDDR